MYLQGLGQPPAISWYLPGDEFRNYVLPFRAFVGRRTGGAGCPRRGAVRAILGAPTPPEEGTEEQRRAC